MAVYEGTVTDREFVVTRDGEPFTAKESLGVMNHSPDGFAWGYSGSGPAQLGLALLLAEGVPADAAVLMHQSFKAFAIATLDIDQGWRMTSEEIQQWITERRALTDANA